MISRELYRVCDRPANFYMMGSMGSALGFGIGLALHTNREVLVIAGDGEVLMSLGTLTLMNKLDLPNLTLCILDNNQYQSTGGQKTCSDAINFTDLCNCSVIKIKKDDKDIPPRIDMKHKDITERFYNEINGCKPFN